MPALGGIEYVKDAISAVETKESLQYAVKITQADGAFVVGPMQSVCLRDKQIGHCSCARVDKSDFFPDKIILALSDCERGLKVRVGVECGT